MQGDVDNFLWEKKLLCQLLDSFVFAITLISKEEKIFSHLQNYLKKDINFLSIAIQKTVDIQLTKHFDVGLYKKDTALIR